VVGGRKLIGSAQFRERGALLQHGSLLIADDQTRVRSLLHTPGGADEEPHAVLAEILGRAPGWDELVSAIAAGFREELGVALQPGGLTMGEEARARELLKRHQDRAWVWRI
jgi:lipoyl(octanoyl) transferase